MAYEKSLYFLDKLRYLYRTFFLVKRTFFKLGHYLTVLFHQMSKRYENGFIDTKNGFLGLDLTFRQSGLYLSSRMAINNQFERGCATKYKYVRDV